MFQYNILLEIMMVTKSRKNNCIRFSLKYQTCLPCEIKYDIAKSLMYS